MENKQTPVEFLIENLKMILPISQFNDVVMQDVFKQSKELEKQQHHKTWLDSACQFDNSAEMTYKKSFEDYYQETYGSKGSDETKTDKI